MKNSFLAIVAAVLFAGNSALADTTTANVKITRLSLTDSGGGMLVQTTPRHTLDTGCTSNFWLVLLKASPNYDALVSMLITAQSRGSDVTVVATGAGSANCTLTRLVLDE